MGHFRGALSAVIVWAAALAPARADGAYTTLDVKAIRSPNGFYAKMISAGGIPIRSSARTVDAALVEAARIVDRMTRNPAVRSRLVGARAGVSIIATDEATTDVPEHAFLKGKMTSDGRPYDTGTRGLGGTRAVPVTSVGEENLVRFPGDVYAGEGILVHEFGHAVMNIALTNDELQAVEGAYQRARTCGLWEDTYAGSDVREYFAEATQSYFDVNQETQPGIHNDVRTRAQLRRYDPVIARILGRIYDQEDPYSESERGLPSDAAAPCPKRDGLPTP